ncbi:MAG: AlpA family phage regulatory protein [Deltaproteobacteria bacterium]|nr:AlpA family phage regulatory protein [Deltaproteobacteria bacterium]
MEAKYRISVLPNVGFLRLRQIIGDAKANPPIPALIPVSRSTFLAGVKTGRFPRGVKLTTRCTAWRLEDILKIIADMGGNYDNAA